MKPIAATAPLPEPHDLRESIPRITVIGVGGAGGNAVSNMINCNLQGVDFITCNTDSQALSNSLAKKKIQIGSHITRGLGAGSRPEVGQASAEESYQAIHKAVQGSNMVFVTAGMGGGTGTGATPVIAQAAREHGILTVAIVTKPFHFEGEHRMKIAEAGIEELEQFVDTLITIPNQNIFRLATERTTFSDAFKLADNVLYSGVRGITDLMVVPGLVNLDFADICTIMMEMGKAIMGTGEAEGESRATSASELAISNPLLDNVSMKDAQGVLINITGGLDVTLFEAEKSANRIREEVDSSANIIFGSTFDDSMAGKMRVSVVATGISQHAKERFTITKTPASEDHANNQDEKGIGSIFSTETNKLKPVPVVRSLLFTKSESEDRQKIGILKQAPRTLGIQHSNQSPISMMPFKRSDDDESVRLTNIRPSKNGLVMAEEEKTMLDIPTYLRRQKK